MDRPPPPSPAVQAPLSASAAYCARHASRPSVGACARCGNYVCEACTDHGRHTQCPDCRQRTGVEGFPFTRDGWTYTGLVRHSWRAFKRQWGALVGSMLLLLSAVVVVALGQFALSVYLFPELLPPPFGTGAAPPPDAFGPAFFEQLFAQSAPKPAEMGIGLLFALAHTPLWIGYTALCVAALRGQPARMGALFAPYRRLPTIAPVVVLSYLPGTLYTVALSALGPSIIQAGPPTGLWLVALAVGGLIALVVGTYVGLGVSFVYAVLATDPRAGAIEVFRRSWRVARGKRWPTFGVYILAAMIMLAGAMLCFIPVVVALPMSMLLWSALYLALSTPTRPTGAAPGLSPR